MFLIATPVKIIAKSGCSARTQSGIVTIKQDKALLVLLFINLTGPHKFYNKSIIKSHTQRSVANNLKLLSFACAQNYKIQINCEFSSTLQSF